jgi:P-type E1-E2 ATPase
MPCAVCARAVDPLRAPRVAHRGGRFRYYCSAECHERRASEPWTSAHTIKKDDESQIEITTSPTDPSVDEGGSEREEDAVVDEGDGALAALSDEPRATSTAPPIEPGLPRIVALPGLVEFDSEPSLEQVLVMLGVSASEARAQHVDEEPLPKSEPLSKLSAPVADEPGDVRPMLVAGAAVFIAAVATRIPGMVSTLFAALAAFVAIAVAGRELWSLRALAPWWLWVNPFAGSLIALARAIVRERPATSLALSASIALVLPIAGYFARAARSMAQRALEAQGAALPRTARAARAEIGASSAGERTVEAQALKAGEEIVVEANERVAVDGVVRKGEAVVEEPNGTRTLTVGQAVLAGTLVRKGSVRVLATRAGDDVALARVRTMLDDHGASRGLFATSFARILGGIVAISVMASLVLAAPKDPLATLALALGALPPGMAIPLARVPFAHALASAIARGTVYRDALAVELAARVRALILCVHATLTRGTLELVEVVSLGSLSERALLATAAGAANAASEQAAARALTQAAKARGVRSDSVRRPVAVAGRGVLAATASGAPIVLGSRALLIAENVAVAPGEEVARSIEAQGRHALFLAIDGRLEGLFGIEDPPRDEARAAVQALMDRGIDVALVGGESAGTLEALGLAIDVSHTRAEVAPEDRGAAVRSIAEVSGRVAVAGRPAIDDVALGAADVSIGIEAAGGAGAETTIALTGNDLREVSRSLLDARDALVSAQRAVMVSLACSVAAVLTAAFGPGPRLAAPVIVMSAAIGAAIASRVAQRPARARP